MSTDTHFVIGATHMVNEDFAYAGRGEREFVIVSDGCSSSPYTDIGSRIVAMSAVEYMNSLGQLALDPQRLMSYAALKSQAATRLLGLPDNAIDATLMLAVRERNEIMVVVYGDGVVGVKFTDGRIGYAEIEYSQNAPFYPSYQSSESRLNEYRALVFNNFKRLDENTVFHERVENDFSSDSMRYSIFRFAVDDVAMVIVGSDGVSSFINTQTQAAYDYSNVITDLLAVKSAKGDFIKRRMRRVLKNMASQDIQNMDDISIGAIAIDR